MEEWKRYNIDDYGPAKVNPDPNPRYEGAYHLIGSSLSPSMWQMCTFCNPCPEECGASRGFVLIQDGGHLSYMDFWVNFGTCDQEGGHKCLQVLVKTVLLLFNSVHLPPCEFSRTNLSGTSPVAPGSQAFSAICCKILHHMVGHLSLCARCWESVPTTPLTLCCDLVPESYASGGIGPQQI